MFPCRGLGSWLGVPFSNDISVDLTVNRVTVLIMKLIYNVDLHTGNHDITVHVYMMRHLILGE